MLAQQWYPYRIAFLMALLCAVGFKTHAQTFQLGTPVPEPEGVVYCETEDTAKVLVTTHAQKGADAAAEYFIDPATPCYATTPIMVVYRRFVMAVDTPEGKMNVYEAVSGRDILFVITNQAHRKNEI